MMTNDDINSYRAAQIFRLEESHLGSPIADNIWRTRSEPVESFTSVAATHWEMVVTRREGRSYLTVRGPETVATITPIPEDAEFFGVQFRLGARLPVLPVDQLVNNGLTLPGASSRSFWLNGSAWEYPTFDNVDVFLKRLLRKGLVVRDPVVEAALQGRRTDLSLRSVQRRIRHTTGLTHAVIKQIERAHQAVALLEAGATILDAVERAGYSDQSHLTRALRRFIGHTPARIVRESAG
jgi:AraC-like DNA-binding protein